MPISHDDVYHDAGFLTSAHRTTLCVKTVVSEIHR